MPDALGRFFENQHNRPLSVAVLIGALFGPASLIIFIERPALFFRLALPTLLLVSVTLSLPIIVLCFSIFYSPMTAIHRAQQEVRGVPADAGVVDALTKDDPLEWPCLLAGSWTAMLAMFTVAVIAYYQSIRIGATFILLAGFLAVLWMVALLFGIVGGRAIKNDAEQRRIHASG